MAVRNLMPVKDVQMRIHPCFTALSSVVMLMAAGESSAQTHRHPANAMSFDEAVAGRARLASSEVSSDILSVGEHPPGPVFGPGYAPGLAPITPANHPADIWPAHTPASFKPYPEISPYYPPNIARDSTYNDRGLWFREILHRRRDFYFDLEYLLTGYAGPGNRNIGARTIRINPVTNEPLGHLIHNYDLGGPATFGPGDENDEFTNFQRVIVGPGVLPYPAFAESEGTDRVFHVQDFQFPVHTLDVINNPVDADGIRARWGYDNEDGTGLMLTGWYGGLGKDRFQRGVDNWWGNTITQELILANTPNDGQAPLFTRNGVLPLEFAEGFPVEITNDQGVGETSYGLTGWSQRFDVLFQVDVETRAFGTTLNLYHEPIYKRKWVSLRPTYGARYIYIDDRFNFRGIDSGLGYTVDELTFRPSGDTVFIPTDINGLPIDLFLEATLNSEVDTHLAGPEAGLRYDFGQSKNFSIWGQSTFAVLVNHERVKISGQNIGDPLDVFIRTEAATGTGVNFTDPDVDSTFLDDDTHTHASPLFEQSIFCQANALRYVPVINRFHILSQAQIQIGYTYTVIGQMARAGESIRWKAFPEFPFVDIDYRTWWMHNLSFGIHWDY
jgi:hypothetical protein